MARISLGSLNLTVVTRSENAQRNLKILEQFLKTIPIVIEELADRTYNLASEQIAPVQKTKFTSASTNGRQRSKKLRTGSPLRKSIYIGPVTESGFTIEAGGRGRNGVKALMQEYGYPYDNWYGPYDPNPNSPLPQFKGLGYLRISLIVAARSLDKNAVDLVAVGASKDMIKNYQRVVSASLNRVLQGFALRFATGNLSKLPAYYANKVKAPRETVPSNVSRFGSFKGLRVNIPLAVEINDRVFYNGQQFKGVTQSATGKSQVASGASFLI